MVCKFDSAMSKRTKYIPLGIIPCTPHSFVRNIRSSLDHYALRHPLFLFFLGGRSAGEERKEKKLGKKTFLNLRSARDLKITGKGQDVWLPLVLITVLAGLHNCFTQIVSKEDIIKFYGNSNFVN